jgi:hypothetical protein
MVKGERLRRFGAARKSMANGPTQFRQSTNQVETKQQREIEITNETK